MIPNAGLDNIAEFRLYGDAVDTGLSGNAADTSGSQWLAYAAISEDSAEPLASDTNIGTEVMRTNSTGGFNRTATAIRDSDAGRLGVSIERAYVFAIDGNYNVTKYGYVPLSSGGNFSWIDLFREDPNDPGSDPVTLTLVPGDELQLWQTFTITVPWSVDLEQFVITGTDGNDMSGTHDAYCGFFATGTSLDTGAQIPSIHGIIRRLFEPSTALTSIVPTPQTASAGRDQSTASTTTGQERGGNAVLAPYVPGSYYRDKVYSFTTAQANMSITAVLLSAIGTSLNTNITAGYGFKVVFDDPATFVKDNLHTLTLTFRVSWAEG